MTTEARPRVRAYVSITSFNCAPSEISRALGLSPTEVWSSGEKIGSTLRTYDENGWSLESTLVTEEDLNAHAQHLLARVPADAVERLAVVTTTHEIHLAYVIEMEHATPPATLSANTVKRLAELNADVDFDMYVFGTQR